MALLAIARGEPLEPPNRCSRRSGSTSAIGTPSAAATNLGGVARAAEVARPGGRDPLASKSLGERAGLGAPRRVERHVGMPLPATGDQSVSPWRARNRWLRGGGSGGL
jgi:hypothetical protein